MHDLKTWTGNIDEFARVAAELLHRLGRTDERPPGIPLLRDYIQRGLLGEIPRRGRDLLFGYHQLVRFAAARVLLADGWPRAKIREYFAVSSTEEIAALVPGLEELSRGEADKGGELRRAQATARPSGGKASTTDQRAGFRERAVRLTAVERELRDALEQLELSGHEDVTEDLMLFSFRPGFRLLVNSAWMDRMTIEDAEAMGRAVTASVLATLVRKGVIRARS